MSLKYEPASEPLNISALSGPLSQAKVLDTRGKEPKRNARGFLVFASSVNVTHTSMYISPAQGNRCFEFTCCWLTAQVNV